HLTAGEAVAEVLAGELKTGDAALGGVALLLDQFREVVGGAGGKQLEVALGGAALTEGGVILLQRGQDKGRYYVNVDGKSAARAVTLLSRRSTYRHQLACPRFGALESRCHSVLSLAVENRSRSYDACTVPTSADKLGGRSLSHGGPGTSSSRPQR